MREIGLPGHRAEGCEFGCREADEVLCALMGGGDPLQLRLVRAGGKRNSVAELRQRRRFPGHRNALVPRSWGFKPQPEGELERMRTDVTRHRHAEGFVYLVAFGL